MENDYLEQTKGRQIDLVVCSDAEAILGIGDQGVGVSDIYVDTPLYYGASLKSRSTGHRSESPLLWLNHN